MRDGSEDEREALDSALRLTWKGDDQGTIHHGRETTAEDGIGREFERLHAHDLAKAGDFDPHNATNGLRRDIPLGNAGATGGQNKATTL